MSLTGIHNASLWVVRVYDCKHGRPDGMVVAVYPSPRDAIGDGAHTSEAEIDQMQGPDGCRTPIGHFTMRHEFATVSGIEARPERD